MKQSMGDGSVHDLSSNSSRGSINKLKFVMMVSRIKASCLSGWNRKAL